MFKSKSFSRVVSLLLIVSILFSVSISTVFAEQTDKSNRNITIEKKVIVEIIDEATGNINEITLYTTPEGQVTKETFKDLKLGYKLKSIKEKEVTPEEQANIGILWVETVFDVGNFMISLSEFNANPSFWNGFWVVLDGATVVFPGVPSISGAKRMIQASPILKEALEYGIKSYKNLPTATNRQRHHIFEKRFAGALGNLNIDDMFSISLRTEDHQLFTTKMQYKIGYYGDLYYRTLTQEYIKQKHVEAYYELWMQTGDSLWEFLYEFAKTGQVLPNSY